MWFQIVLSLLIGTMICAQDNNPQCRPDKAKSPYHDAHFVFGLDFIKNEPTAWKRYTLKTLACEIPKAKNLLTYALDYGAKNPKMMSSNNFVTSDKTGKKLDKLNENPNNDIEVCDELKKRIKEFRGSPFLNKQANTTYILLLKPDKICSDLNTYLDPKIVRIIFYKAPSNSSLTVMNRIGIEEINKDDQIASEGLVQIAKRITAKSLIPPIDSTKSKSKSKKNGDDHAMLFFISIAVCVIFLLVLIISITISILKRRKLKKSKKGAKNVENGTGKTKKMSKNKEKGSQQSKPEVETEDAPKTM
ncbi:unnamed protein product [Caenorhabditis angaria]|uniref:Uncharacterized protein n=1 Tax=Caenorhabditis angaria TaxID=860376 RepID=A0A9P1N422_9PELO|nr:unnamed protein product [Caenorhabditis angaria]